VNRDIVLALAVLSAALLACRPGPPVVNTLIDDAAKRHRCPAKKVVVTSVSPNTYRVRACGNDSTYTCVTHYGDRYTLGYENECVRTD
jgi:hypothetical protein